MASETKAVEAEPAVRDLDEFTKKEEKRLLRKLDFFILTYSCFSYFFNYLDRSAFANAYVAGLKEDLHLVGNQYSILLSLTTAGLVIGQIPNALIIQKIPPRIWLPSMVILWGCLTMCGAACKNYAQFAAVRFLMGLAEASCYAGCVYILGSWYKPAELAKRTALFTIAGQVGTMFAGAMMAAIQRSMDGHSGLKGWQWVFIIDGVITCPIAIMGYLYFPDTPEKTKASYLSPRERDLALSRVPPKRSDSHSLDPFPLMKRIFAGPEIYCLTAFSVLAAALQAFPFQSLFLLYLKHYQDKPFTQTNINTYPIAVQAVGIVSEILTSWYLDKTGHRTRTGLVICSIQIVCAAILLVPNAPHAAAFFAFYTSGSSYAITPLLYGWGNIICIRAGDDAQRAVIIATMVTGGQLLWTWWGIVLYPATDAPYWKKGSIAMICGSVVLGGYLFVVRWLDRRSIAKMPLTVGTEAETSSGDERAATTEDKTSTRV